MHKYKYMHVKIQHRLIDIHIDVQRMPITTAEGRIYTSTSAPNI